MKIKTAPPSPLAMEYMAKKRLNAQSNRSLNLHTDANQTDTVTLSSDKPTELNAAAKPQPSRPVTFEEQQLLSSTFSVQA
jgi:hypothetical protein